MSSRSSENSSKGKNITSTLQFGNSTRSSEEQRKEKHGTHRSKGEAHSSDFGRDKNRSTSSNANRNFREDIRTSNPGVKHVNGQAGMPPQGNPAVTSFSSVRQPAYRKPDSTEQRPPGLSQGAPEFQGQRPSYGMPAQNFGVSRPVTQTTPRTHDNNTPQSAPLTDEKEALQGHDRFIPNVHPMQYPVMFDPMMGYMPYPPPMAPQMRPSMPQPPAAQIQKPTVIIEDDSGNSMNLSTWKGQNSETGEESKAKTSENVDQADEPEATVSAEVATSEKTPETKNTEVSSIIDPVVQKESSTPVKESSVNLTYALMLSYRSGKIDQKLVSKEVLEAKMEIETRNNNENKEGSNQLRYYQPEVESRRSLFGTSVTSVFQQRSNFSNQAENPFTTGRKASLDHISQMKKKLQGALNKITPLNYDALLEKVLEIDFPMICEDPEVMQDLVGMFFDKAINEPTWANVYANLCKDIRLRFEISTDETSAESTENAQNRQSAFSRVFRRALLAHCHKEFDTGRRLQDEINALPQEEKQQRLPMLRKQTFNNMKFIGELYKEKLITKKVMHCVIYTALFEETGLTDEALEMCCELLTNIGESLEEYSPDSYMDTYFLKFSDLAKKYPTARVRFKLQNLIDLRESNWDTDRYIPETPLELKGSRPKSFSSGKPFAAPPSLLPMKKVMNRQPSSSHKPSQRASHASSRSTDDQSRSPQPTTPMTPVTPKTPQYGRDRKKWREVLPDLMKDRHELVETLQDYTINSRKAFLEELFHYLLSVRFREERQNLSELLPEFIEKGIINKREIEQIIVKCVREWVKEETVMDQPKMWESWAEIFCVCMKCESLSSAESIEVAWKELIAKDNAEHIAIFISDVNSKLRNNKDLGVFLRTLDLMSRPELHSDVMQDDRANNPLFDSSLKDYSALSESKMALLADGSSDLDVQKRVYVLMSFLVIHFEKPEVALTVVKHLKNVLDILQPNRNRAEMLFQKELVAARQFMENKAMRSDIEEFLIKHNIMQ